MAYNGLNSVVVLVESLMCELDVGVRACVYVCACVWLLTFPARWSTRDTGYKRA